MFGMIPFVKAAGRGLGAMIKGRKGKETLEKETHPVLKSKSMMMAGSALLAKPLVKK